MNGKARMDVNPAMDTLLAHHLSNAEKENLPNSIYHFTLKTLYPGLLCGAGYEHEIGGKEMEDEYKLGVFSTIQPDCLLFRVLPLKGCCVPRVKCAMEIILLTLLKS